MGITIEIKPINLAQQKIKKTKEGYIELHKSYLRYRMAFIAEEPNDKSDETLGWKDVENSFDIYTRKDKISSIEKWKCTNISRWKIIISVDGMADDMNIYFRTEGSCQEVFNILINYLFQENGNKD